MATIKVAHESFTTLRAKVIVAGDATVGKTALCRVASDAGSEFPKNYVMTTMIDLVVKTVRVKDAPTPTQVELLLLDTPGSSTFNQREQGGAVWSSAAMVALVYDVSSRDSLQSCAKWLRRFHDSRALAAAHAGRSAIRGVLIGTKADLREDDRAEVTESEARSFAESCGLAYFETSAERGGILLEPAFEHLGSLFYRSFVAEMEAAGEL